MGRCIGEPSVFSMPFLFLVVDVAAGRFGSSIRVLLCGEILMERRY